MMEIKDAKAVLEMVDAYGIADIAKAMAMRSFEVMESLERIADKTDAILADAKKNGCYEDVFVPAWLITKTFRIMLDSVKLAGEEKCKEPAGNKRASKTSKTSKSVKTTVMTKAEFIEFLKKLEEELDGE
jgi:hypothetical protein